VASKFTLGKFEWLKIDHITQIDLKAAEGLNTGLRNGFLFDY